MYRFPLHAIAIGVLLFLCVQVSAIDIDIDRQDMQIYDEDLSGSTSEVSAIEKIIGLERNGEWTVNRGLMRVKVSGYADPNEPVDPPVVLPPDPQEPPIGPPVVTEEGVVYSRIPRTQGPKESQYCAINPDNELCYTLQDPDLWDALPEVSRFYSGFNAPGQLVYLHDGVEEIIYDCTTEVKPCVPFDSSVSLDGTKIAFAVYRSDGLTRPWPQNKYIPVEVLSSKNAEAQIYIYNLITKELIEWPHIAGTRETSPMWLPNGKVMFSTNRAGFWRPYLHQRTPASQPDPRLYIANEDGSGQVDITPHEFGGALHPHLLSNGRVAYSSFWLSHNLAYISTNGSINWPTTTDNMWQVSDMDIEGGDMTVLLGGHRNQFRADDGFTKNMKALHFIGERYNSDVCVGNYYRANNMGLGDVYCWPPMPKELEGPAPAFLPKDIYSVADWSRSNDEPSKKIDGVYQGKLGFPEGTPDGQLLLTVGRGYCTTVAISWNATPNLNGQPGCDTGIYKTTVIPSKVIGDIEKIADSPEWHEFNARVVVARNVPIVPMIKTEDDSCVLASSDAGSTDAHGKNPYTFNNNYFNMANNGGEIDGLDHSELAAIRIYLTEPNKTKFPSGEFKNHMGNPLSLLGDIPLLADNSFAAEVPCDTAFLMAGVDKDGLVIKRDQLPMSLRPGEKRICMGCHLHGSEGRPYEQSLAYTATPVKLLDSKPVPTFADIEPILQERCASCHTDDLPLDYDGLVWDFFQKKIPDDWRLQVSNHTTENRRYGLQRPQTSKYVNNMFARESLLYQVCVGKRTDGRTNDTYSTDIDFPVAHPVTATAQECETIGSWLDSGATQ